MSLPTNCNSEKIAEVAIGLMYLTLHGRNLGLRAWKGFDWDILDSLHEKGWIGDPKGKARSVIITEEGKAQAQLMFEKHFGPER